MNVEVTFSEHQAVPRIRIAVDADGVKKPVLVERLIRRAADPWIVVHDVESALSRKGLADPDRQAVRAKVWSSLCDRGLDGDHGWIPVLPLGEAVRFGLVQEPSHSGIKIVSNAHLLSSEVQGWERELLGPTVTELVVKMAEEANEAV